MNLLGSEDLGNLMVRVGLDGTELDKGLKNVNARLSLARSEMRASTSSFGTLGTAADRLKARQEGLTKQYDLQGVRVQQLRNQYDALVTAHGAESDAALKAGAKLNSAIGSYNNLGNEIGEVSKELAYQESSWATASNALENFSGKAQSLGGNLQSVGTGLTAGITAPIVALAGTSATAAIKFESAFAGVRKTVDATEDEFAVLKQGIRDMALEIPAAATEIARVGEAAGQLGIENEAILGFTRTMVDLGVATDLSSDQAAMALARLATITGMNQQDFDRLGSTIVALGNNFAAVESEITEMGLRLAGAGNQVGLTEADILALSTALVSVGINAEAGGSAFSRVMIEMAGAVDEGGQKLNDFARISGMSANEFKDAFETDASMAIEAFVRGLGNISDESESTFAVLDQLGLSEIRVRDALLRTSGASDTLTDALKVSNEAWDENIALTEEAETRYGTTESQLIVFWNRLKDVAITLGDELLPVINDMLDAAVPFIDWLADMVNRFGELDDSTKFWVLTIAGIAVALGPVIVALGTLIRNFGVLAGALGRGTAALGRYRTSAALTATSINALGTTATVTATRMNTANTAMSRTGRGMRGLRGGATAAGAGMLLMSDGIGSAAGMALMFLPELLKLGKGVGSLATKAIKGGANLLGFGKNTSDAGKATSSLASNTAKGGGALSKFGATSLVTSKNIGSMASTLRIARLGFAALGGPVGLGITAITLLAEGGYHLYQHMREELIPTITDFGDEVSDSTTEAVLAYKKLNDDVTTELNGLAYSGQTITGEMAESLTGQFQEMGQTIKEGLKAEFDESKSNLELFLKDSKAITEEEQAEIYANLDGMYEARKGLTQRHQDQINEIIETASQEKRSLTKEEQEEINQIQVFMMNQAVRTLSDSEVEQIAIMERLKQESENISAKQAAEIVKNSVAAKEGSIKEANDKYNEVVAAIIRERDETGTISKEQADALIKEAERQRDESILAAETMHDKVVRQAQLQADGQIRSINWTTGEVLTRWDRFKGDLAYDINSISKGINSMLEAFGISKRIPMWEPNGRRPSGPGVSGTGVVGNGGNTIPAYETGTSLTGHPQDGWAITSEKGRELVHDPKMGTYLTGSKGPEMTFLHKGASVLPNHHTEQLLKSYGFPAYEKGIGDYFDLFMQGPSALAGSVFNKLIGTDLGGVFKDITSGIFSNLKKGAAEFLKGILPEVSLGGSGFGPPYRMTSPFGYRIHPITKQRRFHAGVDYAAPTGTPIPSQSAGMVSFSGWSGGYGNMVEVNSGKYSYRYAHNSKNLVGRGALVVPGQTIALVGSTGQSTGPHVHYEKRLGGTPINPIGRFMGGRIAKPEIAAFAENGWPEYAITTEPQYRNRSLDLYNQLGTELGVPDVPRIRDRNGDTLQTTTNVIEEISKKLDGFLDRMHGLITINNRRPIEVGLDINSKRFVNATFEDIEERLQRGENRKLRKRGGG
ncbi:phage tail tape measure protein [Alkalihalophilus lindianensis]|uniref:Phage tail tape measure protein n=1 Tax=Alkalihalophilus lindianensis TaxID=1630542 RepID=A0ABU3X7D2_9BACI|nr:phage tail tape measure protein [Alkalihalophilus lindianensis]MDV2683800.1 phage tail tape measure protein [Alkalihalophilus lindianensis]MDV2683866.1 phage tail tape measure protein [Alkalihalophilus lindianensis]